MPKGFYPPSMLCRVNENIHFLRFNTMRYFTALAKYCPLAVCLVGSNYNNNISTWNYTIIQIMQLSVLIISARPYNKQIETIKMLFIEYKPKNIIISFLTRGVQYISTVYSPLHPAFSSYNESLELVCSNLWWGGDWQKVKVTITSTWNNYVKQITIQPTILTIVS